MTLDDLGDRLFAYVPEVAQVLGRDERTVRAAIKAGQIPATKTGQRYIVRVSWLREQAGQPAPVPAAMPDLDELAERLADRVADRVIARFARLFGAKTGDESDGRCDAAS
jgi:excisionase family DNA binding protein